MENKVREVLRKLIYDYGEEIFTDHRKLSGLLFDYCPSEKKEIRAILIAREERIPEELIRIKDHTLEKIVSSRLVEKLLKQTPLSEEAAQWAIETWWNGIITYPSTDNTPSLSLNEDEDLYFLGQEIATSKGDFTQVDVVSKNEVGIIAPKKVRAKWSNRGILSTNPPQSTRQIYLRFDFEFKRRNLDANEFLVIKLLQNLDPKLSEYFVFLIESNYFSQISISENNLLFLDGNQEFSKELLDELPIDEEIGQEKYMVRGNVSLTCTDKYQKRILIPLNKRVPQVLGIHETIGNLFLNPSMKALKGLQRGGVITKQSFY